MHSLAASKEKEKSKSHFVKENKHKEHKSSSNCMKVFQVLYWTCKEEVELGSLSLKTLKLDCQGPFKKIILVLVNVVRENIFRQNKIE